jgi:hypothetical protein
LLAPFFGGEGAQLHRYLEPNFVQRFQLALQRRQLNDPEANAWKDADRFSDHDNKLVLRLPMHKTFYLVSCEVSCDRLGLPALDPGKITSAGFVIRRLADSGEQSWMLEDDEALGWEDSPTGLRDPDVHRRLCRDGTLHPRENVPTYTGEQTHPLHPVKATDENGKTRTVLYGYLPLGGTYISRQLDDQSLFDAESLKAFKTAAAAHLPWPYGVRKPLSRRWRAEYERPVDKGIPCKQFFELLRLLLNRYHLGEDDIMENSGLKALTQGIYFYNQTAAPASLAPGNFNDYTKESYKAWRKYSLWSWLQYHARSDNNRLVEWMALQEKQIDAAGGIEKPVKFDRLPARSDTAFSSYSLYLTASDAQSFRTALDQRVLDQAIASARELPLPKFRQNAEDVYQVLPFVRVKEDNGKERIYWGEDVRSEAFRVASPFDPHASRPSLIQMPSLRDLKKGLAKGVSMLTPPDTFNLINSLNLKKGASEDVLPQGEPSGIGIQWICSFSLPVITLVAMILLMIMISLLNIVFFWLPWIKICLPFPKIK